MNAPHGGGALPDLVARGEEGERLRREASRLSSLTLSERSRCDLDLIADGAFAPLRSFLGHRDYERVLEEMRLADGTLWPIPLTLPVPDDAPVALGKDVALRDLRNDLVGVLRVEEIFEWSAEREARRVLATNDQRHPLVAEMARWGRRLLAGPVRVLERARALDFTALRLSPREVRAKLETLGFANVVAFQTRNPMHRSHEELTKRAAEQCQGALLLHPVVGLTKPGDVDHYTRVRGYKALVERYYDPKRTLLALLPLAMRMAGPREALWHAIIRRNYGASHFIVGRDHAGPGNDSTGRPFYGPYNAQELVARYAEEIGVTMVPFKEMVYLPKAHRYEEEDKVPVGSEVLRISGTQVRDEYLAQGRRLPAWFTRREMAATLSETHPPAHRRGFCVWFTGLSGAGKSATAEALTSLLLERGRQVTVLDGDVVRTHLSKGLGFSREDRDANVRRIGFVAAEIVRHGGVALCAAVSPYRATRTECRERIGTDRFFEIFVDAPLAVCESRDSKGLYAKARRGELTGFTGVDDPYEAPEAPELRLDTVAVGIAENAHGILALLVERGFLLA